MEDKILWGNRVFKHHHKSQLLFGLLVVISSLLQQYSNCIIKMDLLVKQLIQLTGFHKVLTRIVNCILLIKLSILYNGKVCKKCWVRTKKINLLYFKEQMIYHKMQIRIYKICCSVWIKINLEAKFQTEMRWVL